MSAFADLAAAARRVRFEREQIPEDRRPPIDAGAWNQLAETLRACTERGDSISAAAAIESWEGRELARIAGAGQ